MESNTNWLIDSRRTNVYAFTTGRFVSKSFIAKVAAGADIPDRFGGTKLCGGPKKEKLEQSTFVLLFKHPHNDSFPYCYEIGYITYENERFSVYRNSGKVLAGDRNYWLAPVSKRDKSYLLSIWRNVLRNH
ncbi:hypothetical protein [Burkholderia sp. WSM2232]|uniref:hypothetical protein n=1 Tax=Burkholderia sp. WSM2232 TaxID=944436 RepID=UPI0012EBD283|nr:hypothetical protein [Burkholderia sp. WSM2232]